MLTIIKNSALSLSSLLHGPDIYHFFGGGWLFIGIKAKKERIISQTHKNNNKNQGKKDQIHDAGSLQRGQALLTTPYADPEL